MHVSYRTAQKKHVDTEKYRCKSINIYKRHHSTVQALLFPWKTNPKNNWPLTGHGSQVLMGSGLDRLLSHGHLQKVAWLSFAATVLPWHPVSDLEHLNCQLKMVHSSTVH